MIDYSDLDSPTEIEPVDYSNVDVDYAHSFGVGVDNGAAHVAMYDYDIDARDYLFIGLMLLDVRSHEEPILLGKHSLEIEATWFNVFVQGETVFVNEGPLGIRILSWMQGWEDDPWWDWGLFFTGAAVLTVIAVPVIVLVILRRRKAFAQP